MLVLLSDGSGLTARQCATQLAAGGHGVEVLSSDRFALTRFTRHVRRVHEVPPYGLDPCGWLDAALDVWTSGAFDVLLPTQEQVAVLSCYQGRLQAGAVATAVPPFASLERVQDKIAARATLDDLGLRQPESAVVGSRGELVAWDRLPTFVKTPIGTATIGVRRVASAVELNALADDYEAAGVFTGGGVVVQAPVSGPLVMAQSVFDPRQAGRIARQSPGARGRTRWGESEAIRREPPDPRGPGPARGDLAVARRAVRGRHPHRFGTAVHRRQSSPGGTGQRLAGRR